MRDDPIGQLTERQRQLLDLVAAGTRTSKDIAAVTGLAPKTIDNTLLAAGKVLGARDRGAAASQYRRLLAEKSPEGSPGRSESLLKWRKSGLFDVTSSGERGIRATASFMRDLFRGVPLGGRKHNLRWDQITLEIVRVAIIGAAGLLGVLLFVLGLSLTLSWI